MSNATLTLPVTVEQIALVVQQMSLGEQQRLLELVPPLRQLVVESPVQKQPRTLEQARENVALLKVELEAATVNQPPHSDDTPFLGGLTLGQYRALSDEEKAAVWAEAERDFVYPEEKEIRADAVPAR